jgi:MFS transporter, DHA1 family, tetracycline resistance protein
LGASPVVIGLFIAIYPFCSILAGPYLGALSDRYGRKPVLIFSLVGTVAGFFLLGTAKTLLLVFLARIIDGFSAGNGSTARAAVADMTSKGQRTSKIGTTFAMESLGLILGPVIGGFFSQYGLAISAYIACAIAMVSLLLTGFAFRETKSVAHSKSAKKSKKSSSLKEMLGLFSDGKTKGLMLAIFSVQLLIMMMWGTLALFGQHFYGFTGKELGYISAFAATIGIFSQVVMLKLLLRFLDEKTILVLGLVGMAIGMACLALSGNAVILLVGVGLMAACFNISMPTAVGLASKAGHRIRHGVIMGTVSSATNIGSLLGPIIGTAVFSLSMRGIYGLGSLLAMMIATSVLLIFRHAKGG